MKTQILDQLAALINSKPGLEPGNYGFDTTGRAMYRAESRAVTADRHTAHELLRAVERAGAITAADIIAAAQSGRLNYSPQHGWEYTAGQYGAVEYRAAACRLLAGLLWNYYREHCNCSTGDAIRAAARREFRSTRTRRFFV